jgi:hypothetical protein
LNGILEDDIFEASDDSSLLIGCIDFVIPAINQ